APLLKTTVALAQAGVRHEVPFRRVRRRCTVRRRRVRTVRRRSAGPQSLKFTHFAAAPEPAHLPAWPGIAASHARRRATREDGRRGGSDGRPGEPRHNRTPEWSGRFAGAGVDLEDRYSPPGLDAPQLE